MGVLDLFFLAITAMGSEMFYLLALPLLYWCVDTQLAFETACVFLSSIWCNSLLKDIFRVPRPPLGSVRFPDIERGQGWSFPSGHAQGTSSFWGHLAFSRPTGLSFRLLAVAIIVLVAVSRVYLGVHWPTDVIGGTVIGLALVYLLRVEPIRAGESPIWVVAGSVLYLLYSGGDAPAAAGALQGLALGHLGQKKWVNMDTGGSETQKLVRYLLGLAIMIAVLLGLKLVLPGSAGFRFLRYLVTGLGASLLAPWLFVTTGLCRRS